MTERVLNDRYALESKIGEGGMAVTYRARDLLLNRTVAVKLMREQFTTDLQFVERFRREAQAAARLTHENIAGVYDTGRANGMYYIVMEYVEGTDLKQRLRRDGPMSIMAALETARQIAAALDAAHRGGLVHRDIKPHNILLNQDGKVKVTDFGIAKMVSDGEDTGVIIGSVHYISPEQARGEATTPSSDIYSLGAVLFEMLTGRTIFEAENAMAVAHKQIYERPPLPRTLRPEIPPVLESVVMRCLEKDPRARYQSAAELQAVLTQLANQLSQEETIVITPAAPPMDATMIIQAPAPPPPPARSAAHPDPFRVPPPSTTLPPREEHRDRSWLLTVLIVAILAIGVGVGAYYMLTKPSGGGIVNQGWGGQPIPPPPPPTESATIPSVIGKLEQDAITTLKGLGLRPTVTYAQATDATIADDQVFKQDPAAKSPLIDGAPITLWVNQSPTIIVTEVAGSSDRDARVSLRNGGFKGDFVVQYDTTSTLPAAQVIRTIPAEGETMNRHARLTLVEAPLKQVVTQAINETYDTKIPSIAAEVETVYYRVEIQRNGGAWEQITDGTGKPGTAIPTQTFTRGATEKVVLRLRAGKDENSLDEMEHVSYPPGQSGGG
jgi:serine/threonine-protein kinase